MGSINSKKESNLSINSYEIKHTINKKNKKLNETEFDIIDKQKNREVMIKRLLELF